MKVIRNIKIEIEIERPNGITEIVDVSEKFWNMSENHFKTHIFDQIKTNTKKAGKGNVKSYSYAEAVIEHEDKDFENNCERCNAKIDTRIAYHQNEIFRGMPVIVYYCKDCHELLGMVGLGEMTALEEKRTEKYSIEPITKED
jgi:hypothetical protein